MNFYQKYNREMEYSLSNLNTQNIAKAVEILLEAYKKKNVIFSVGNGGSASTAAHFTADLGKFATGDKEGFKAIDLVSNSSSHTAWTNDTNWENTWSAMLKPWIGNGDVLVLFSVNGGIGWSNNLINAILLSKERGAKTIGIAGAEGGRFAELCDVTISIPIQNKELITPISESFHVVVHHMICAALRNEI